MIGFAVGTFVTGSGAPSLGIILTSAQFTNVSGVVERQLFPKKKKLFVLTLLYAPIVNFSLIDIIHWRIYREGVHNLSP